MLEGQFHGALEIRQLERLGQVVEGPEAHRLDRGLDAAVARHHDDLGVGVMLLAVFDDFQPVHVADQEVDDHQVGGESIEGFDPFAARLDRRGVVALLPAQLRHELENSGFVVNDQDSGHGFRVVDDLV